MSNSLAASLPVPEPGGESSTLVGPFSFDAVSEHLKHAPLNVDRNDQTGKPHIIDVGTVSLPGPHPASSTRMPGRMPALSRIVFAPATASTYGFSSSGTSQAGQGHDAQPQPE